MKKPILTLLLCSFSLGLISQSDVWTKADRTNLYDDCMSYVTKYKNTSNDQRESISLCYMGEVTKKYTKVDFQAMIDIEIKRIKEAVINQCAKNLGIDLNVEPKKEEPVVEKKEVVLEKKEMDTPKSIATKEGIIGKWKTDENSIFEFRIDGTYTKTYLYSYYNRGWHVKDNLYSGDWFLDEGGSLKLTLNWIEERVLGDKNYTDSNGVKYNFITFSKDFIKIETTDIGYKIIQANRMK